MTSQSRAAGLIRRQRALGSLKAVSVIDTKSHSHTVSAVCRQKLVTLRFCIIKMFTSKLPPKAVLSDEVGQALGSLKTEPDVTNRHTKLCSQQGGHTQHTSTHTVRSPAFMNEALDTTGTALKIKHGSSVSHEAMKPKPQDKPRFEKYTTHTLSLSALSHPRARAHTHIHTTHTHTHTHSLS